LLFIFVSQDRLERSPVQVKGNNICRSKRCLGQSSEEEFIDYAIAKGANGSSGRGGWMGCNDDSHPKFCPSQGDIRTVEESTAGSRFGMGEHLVRGQSKTSPYLGKVK